MPGTWTGEERRTHETAKPGLNAATRSGIVLLLVSGFTLAFVSVLWTGKIIVDVGAYAAVLGVAMTWLFKGGDAVQQASEVREAVKAATVPAAAAVSKAEERAQRAEDKVSAVNPPGGPTP